MTILNVVVPPFDPADEWFDCGPDVRCSGYPGTSTRPRDRHEMKQPDPRSGNALVTFSGPWECDSLRLPAPVCNGLQNDRFSVNCRWLAVSEAFRRVRAHGSGPRRKEGRQDAAPGLNFGLVRMR
jgi:hypothetical protein